MKKWFSLMWLLGLTLASVAQQTVYLKGNVVPGNSVELTSIGDDVWQKEVTLDDSNVFLFSDKYVYFECPSANYKSGNVRINGGSYTVRFSMKDKSFSFSASMDPYRISAFGSSVCNGQGATGYKGYAWLYGELLGQRYANKVSDYPFYTSGVAIGGNTTRNLLDRYVDLTRNHSRYVIIGLSMGNEGVHEAGDKDQIVNQFSANMQTIISKVKADGMVPVVMNNYTRGDFTAEDYAAIKKMNLIIHQWNVTSVNTLGAIDDGAGHWASGYMQDNAHPTTNGHKEFFYAMTPSLFDALASGKAQPVRTSSASMTLGGGNTIAFRGEEMVHPFTISLRVKGSKDGRLLAYSLTSGTREGRLDVDEKGRVVYTSAMNRTLTTEQSLGDGQWHVITLTHYYAQGRTLLYFDQQLAGELRERVNALGNVVIGDTVTTTTRQVSELFFWRAGMTPEEVSALCSGKMLKSSLELYVPTVSAHSLVNKAMSMNTVQYVPNETVGISPLPTPDLSAVETVYNLAGQRVEAPQNGVFVRNGRLWYSK